MTLDSHHTAGNGPGTWAEVATTVYDALQRNSADVITVVVGSRDMLQIDIARYSFEWSTPLAEFPTGASGLRIAVNPAADFSATPKNLDSLLWTLGNNAFGGAAAPWLQAGQRVRLSRWPNMPRHLHGMQQMYMLAALGNAYFSAGELAAASKAPEATAQDLINALSLMQLLKYSAEAPPVVIAPSGPQHRQQPQSLFARLRARLGR